MRVRRAVPLVSVLDEQAFRFNNRGGNDAMRFDAVLGKVVGRRLTYDALIGPTDSENRPA